MDGTPSRGEVAIRLSASCYWNGDKLRFTFVSLGKILTWSRQRELGRRMCFLLSLVLHCQNVLWTHISEHACRLLWAVAILASLALTKPLPIFTWLYFTCFVSSFISIAALPGEGGNFVSVGEDRTLRIWKGIIIILSWNLCFTLKSDMDKLIVFSTLNFSHR